MVILFWETLQCNKRFRSFIIDGERSHEFMILMLFYALEYRADPAKQGVVRMCVFVLQTLSTETNFGRMLNQELANMESLPPGVRIPDFQGSYADLLLIVRLLVGPFTATFTDNSSPSTRSLRQVKASWMPFTHLSLPPLTTLRLFWSISTLKPARSYCSSSCLCPHRAFC